MPVPDCLFPLFCSGWQLETTTQPLGHMPSTVVKPPHLSGWQQFHVSARKLKARFQFPSRNSTKQGLTVAILAAQLLKHEANRSAVFVLQPFMRISTQQDLVPCGLCAAGMQWLGCADHPFLSFTLLGFSFPECSRRESRPFVPWRWWQLEGARLLKLRSANTRACCQANWLPRSLIASSIFLFYFFHIYFLYFFIDFLLFQF